MHLKFALLGPKTEQDRFKQRLFGDQDQNQPVRTHTVHDTFTLQSEPAGADGYIILLDHNTPFAEQWEAQRKGLTAEQLKKPIYIAVCPENETAPLPFSFYTGETVGFWPFKSRAVKGIHRARTEKEISALLRRLTDSVWRYSDQYKASLSFLRRPVLYFAPIVAILLATSVFVLAFSLPFPWNTLGLYTEIAACFYAIWSLNGHYECALHYFKTFGMTASAKVPWQWFLSKDLQALGGISLGVACLAGLTALFLLGDLSFPAGTAAATAFIALGFAVTGIVSFFIGRAMDPVKVELPLSDSSTPAPVLSESIESDNSKAIEQTPAPTHKVVSRASQWWSKVKSCLTSQDTAESESLVANAEM